MAISNFREAQFAPRELWHLLRCTTQFFLSFITLLIRPRICTHHYVEKPYIRDVSKQSSKMGKTHLKIYIYDVITLETRFLMTSD